MDFDTVVDFGVAKCPFPNCGTKIIPYTESLKSAMVSISNAPETVNTTSDPSDFFRIASMWDFDNIGVSREVPEQKNVEVDQKPFNVERILICSECDKGPIGFAGHFTDEENTPHNLTYFLSCRSVKYSQ